MYYRRIKITYLVLHILLFMVPVAYSQDQVFDKVQIKTVRASENIYMLLGHGGNIGVCVGEEGVFLVDDQFAPLTEKIKAALGEISGKDVRFVINTHWHFDHVGGNEKMGETGAVIVAHENVRKRMSTDQFIKFFQKEIPASSKIALPIITFAQDITFHLNEEEIVVFHVNNAHTDGDAIVYFRNSNVIHMGDIYFSGIYPFIDTSSKGTVNGVINAAKGVLSFINDDTKIIPGHGPLSNKAELTVYVDMLISLKDKISKHILEGKTLEEVLAGKPTQEFDTKWGNGFLSPDQFVQILYEDLSGI